MSSSKARSAARSMSCDRSALPRASAAEDLRALEVQWRNAASRWSKTRRDRYECHNWAVEQTGESPAAGPPSRRADARRARDGARERIDRAIVGAAIGGAIGGISCGRRRESSDRVLAGAAAGAAIGAATAGNGASRREAEEAEEPSDYLRALTACLEGRGYLGLVADGGGARGEPLTRAAARAPAPGGCSSADVVG